MTLDILLPVAFLAGLLGSGHCLGMCGPVVTLFESPAAAGPGGQPLPRRVAYNTGRLLFYVLLGVVAGAVGTVLTKVAGVSLGLAILRALAAVLIVALGLNLLLNLKLLRPLESGGSALWKRVSPLAKHVLPMSSWPRSLAAGALWGALPCGLVYSAVAIAATSGSGPAGGLVMLAFWTGTLPALLLAGAAARKLNALSTRPSLRRLTGAAMIAVGLFALAMPYMHMGGHAGDRDDSHAGHAVSITDT